MSEDKLREFIRQERDDFDSEEPGEGVWGRIHTELHQQDELGEKPRRSWAIAASVAAILAIGALLFTLDDSNRDAEVKEHRTAGLDLSAFGEELAEVDRYYAIQVGQRMERLSAYDVDKGLMEEMNFLNEEFESLKEEMGEGIDDTKVVEALIENYRLRLQLLEDLLEAVESNNTNGENEDIQL